MTNKSGINSILFFITNIMVLKTVIDKHNKLEKIAQDKKWDICDLQRKQNLLLIRWGLLYGMFLCAVLLYFFMALTEKIISIYPDMLFLKTNVTFVSMLIVSYVLAVKIAMRILKWGVDTANTLRKLPQKAANGTKKIVKKTIGHIGKRTVQSAKFAKEKAVISAKFFGKQTAKGARLTGKGVVKGGKIAGKGALFGIGLTAMMVDGTKHLVSKIFKRKKNKV